MIRLKKIVLIGIIVSSALLVATVAYIIMPRGKVLTTINASILLPYIQEGDIICRLGNRFWSQYFKDVSLEDKRFSHLGIIHISNDNVMVINAEGNMVHNNDFVHEVTLQEFLNVACAVGIYRSRNIDGSLIAYTALQYKGFPFDWQFDLSDEDSLYCSELLYAVLKKIDPDIRIKTIFFEMLGKEIVPLEAVSNSEYFSEIYYTAAPGTL
ncbi:MAG: hypothetical protein LBT11_02375 [Treponema sp.]|jgi:hypothetical protein|nr:hypothetical protein [Treponema sp.]